MEFELLGEERDNSDYLDYIDYPDNPDAPGTNLRSNNHLFSEGLRYEEFFQNDYLQGSSPDPCRFAYPFEEDVLRREPKTCQLARVAAEAKVGPKENSDECCICLDSLHKASLQAPRCYRFKTKKKFSRTTTEKILFSGGPQATVFCSSGCGNVFHKNCIFRVKKKKKQEQRFCGSCAYCQSDSIIRKCPLCRVVSLFQEKKIEEKTKKTKKKQNKRKNNCTGP